MKAETIIPGKNLQAAVPPALLTQIKRAAEAEHITVDQFVQEAVENLLNRKEWRDPDYQVGGVSGNSAKRIRHTRFAALKPALTFRRSSLVWKIVKRVRLGVPDKLH